MVADLQAQPNTTVEANEGRRAVRGRAGKARSAIVSGRGGESSAADYDAWAAMRSGQTAVVVLEPRAAV